MLPLIKIVFATGLLGIVGNSPDGLVALASASNAVSTSFELGKPYTLTQKSDADALGLTAENNPLLVKHIKDFYRQAPEGTKLVIFGFDKTKKMSEVCSTEENGILRRLIEAEGGKLRAIFLSSEAGDTEAPTEGLSPDVYASLTPAQELAEWATDTLYAPLFIVLDGRGYTGQNLRNLSEGKSHDRVAVLVGDTEAESQGSCLGIMAGRLATIPVQRNLGRVKDGALKPEAFYLGGKRIEEKSSEIMKLHDAGYITLRRYVGRTGYFFTDDNLASPRTEDYAQISRRRVIDKAYRIAYNALLERLLDEVELNADGTMQASIIKAWETEVEEAINREMTASGELSSEEGRGCQCFIDTGQNVLSTSRVAVTLKVRPMGCAREINVNLGFLVDKSTQA